MKKVLLSAAIAIFATSCVEKTYSTDVASRKPQNNTIDGSDYEIYEVDGCEYIGSDVGCTYGFLTHKGNCKFCIERNKSVTIK